MTRTLSLLGALALLALASPAAAWTAQNGFSVQSLSNGQFEVRSRGGLSSSQAWCAAGDFALRRLGVSGSTLVFRLSEPPRRSGESIVFSLAGQGAASSTGLMTLGGPGGGARSAISAQSLCVSASRRNR